MSKKTKNVISVGVMILILVGLYAIKFGFDMKPRLGLDLQGGISLVYEARPSKGKVLDAGVLEKTVEKIRTRVDKMGVGEPDITTQGTKNVIVQLPGIHDKKRAINLIGQTAQLQFRIVSESKSESEAKKDPGWKVTPDDQRREDKPVTLAGPDKEKEKVILKLGPTLLTGDAVKRAEVSVQEGASQVDFEMTGDGASKFADITKANVNKQLAIVLDYKVESAPNIKEAITEGKGNITGNFTDQETKDLVIVINTGALPVELTRLTENDVTATLGRDSLKKGVIAGLIGIVVVVLFMLVYYRVLGVITCLGLMVFGGLMFGFICVLGSFWTLTLAGVAGIIVSIGIAADSSIVFFERLKEDVKAGRSMRSSVDTAYKSAFRTIIAADTVSFTTAAILYLFAIGSVKGFALTLGIATIFDVFISYCFVRPLTSLLAGWKLLERPGAIGACVEADLKGGEA
ncbi:MAG: protein translocase subunit SecD [Candidatus Anoxymicrobium japonicum]|uniref:Protein translocase subunit SecD n=1 Tax=Candidatus Anoxymicrobium japonicum TaxID=2013648 RepID=A0A2N3G806_9ACTN|nr:MAG: protein translocase subunit SecD [Candidatus Anoxymicrobium japonicum]